MEQMRFLSCIHYLFTMYSTNTQRRLNVVEFQIKFVLANFPPVKTKDTHLPEN